jgi:polar amino acid transport system substrate-binding protein
VQQAIGTARKNSAGARVPAQLCRGGEGVGFRRRLIQRHKVIGLSVAPPA